MKSIVLLAQSWRFDFNLVVKHVYEYKSDRYGFRNSDKVWEKDTVDYVKTMVSDPKGTLKALWEGKDPITGESILPEWMTKPLKEMQWYILKLKGLILRLTLLKSLI